jgi:predicted acyl esterase
MKHRCFYIFAVVVWSALSATKPSVNPSEQALTQAQQPSPLLSPTAEKPGKETGQGGMHLIRGFKIPMRDGIRLNGTVFKANGQNEPLPVIFTLTPYIADT